MGNDVIDEKFVSGSFTLKEIESAIQFEETKSYELTGWSIEGNGDNKLLLKRLKFGAKPKALKLMQKDQGNLSGYKKVSSGQMIVEDEDDDPIDVIAWRIE